MILQGAVTRLEFLGAWSPSQGSSGRWSGPGKHRCQTEIWKFVWSASAGSQLLPSPRLSLLLFWKSLYVPMSLSNVQQDTSRLSEVELTNAPPSHQVYRPPGLRASLHVLQAGAPPSHHPTSCRSTGHWQWFWGNVILTVYNSWSKSDDYSDVFYWPSHQITSFGGNKLILWGHRKMSWLINLLCTCN